MTDALQQIRCSFSREEDRVLLELNTGSHNAYRLWLTRRFVKLLWQKLLERFEGDPDVVVQPEPRAKRAVMAFQQQKAVQESDFSRQYESTELAYPLGEEPLLLTKFTLGRQKEGATPLRLHTAKGAAVTVNLNREQYYSFCHLLMSATRKSGWNLNLVIGDAGVAAARSPRQLH